MPWRSAKVLGRAIEIQRPSWAPASTVTGGRWPTGGHRAGFCPPGLIPRLLLLAWRPCDRTGQSERPQSHLLYPFQGRTVVAPHDRGRGGDLRELRGTGWVRSRKCVCASDVRWRRAEIWHRAFDRFVLPKCPGQHHEPLAPRRRQPTAVVGPTSPVRHAAPPAVPAFGLPPKRGRDGRPH